MSRIENFSINILTKDENPITDIISKISNIGGGDGIGKLDYDTKSKDMELDF